MLRARLVEKWGVRPGVRFDPRANLGLDSLDVVELVTELEEEFEIIIPDDQTEKITTFADIVECLERCLTDWIRY
jgi:acyl carrier protein